MNGITDMAEKQVLRDIDSRGKERNWSGRKINNRDYAKILENIGLRKFDRVYHCADTLLFGVTPDGERKLKQAFFCKSKLCPMCSWRRAMRHSYNVSQILEEAIKETGGKGSFLFLTLSAQNVWGGEELNKAMSDLTTAFRRLFLRAKVKKNLIGFVRATEVTVSDDPKKPTWRGSYNQHMHVLLMVKTSYFRGKENYISQAEWTKLWQDSLRVDYKPIVNVKRVYAKSGKDSVVAAALETAKYPVKPIKYRLNDSFSDEEVEQIVADLEEGLNRKRQIGYGGLFKEIAQKLKLSNAEDENANLVNIEDDETVSPFVKEIIAQWNWRRKNYFIKD